MKTARGSFAEVSDNQEAADCSIELIETGITHFKSIYW